MIADVFPVQYIANWRERLTGRGWLPSKMHQRPFVMLFFQTIADGVQNMEDSIYGAGLSVQLDAAQDRILDFWGWVFGVRRGGLKDEWYRRLIYAAARAKRMSGNYEDVIGFWKEAAAPAHVEVEPLPFGEVRVNLFREDYMPLSYSKRVAALFRSVSPGIKTTIVEAQHGFFGFSGRTTPPLPFGFGVGTLSRSL